MIGESTNEIHITYLYSILKFRTFLCGSLKKNLCSIINSGGYAVQGTILGTNT